MSKCFFQAHQVSPLFQSVSSSFSIGRYFKIMPGYDGPQER